METQCLGLNPCSCACFTSYSDVPWALSTFLRAGCLGCCSGDDCRKIQFPFQGILDRWRARASDETEGCLHMGRNSSFRNVSGAWLMFPQDRGTWVGGSALLWQFACVCLPYPQLLVVSQQLGRGRDADGRLSPVSLCLYANRSCSHVSLRLARHVALRKQDPV